jgi:hypothetical protein
MKVDRVHTSIEDAISDTVHYSVDPVSGEPLTVKAIATDINVRSGTLQDAADPRRDQPMHATWIVPLVKRTKNYAIVRFICRAVGGVFIQLPVATNGNVVNLVQVIGTVMKEVADVVRVASEAISGDGHVDARERAELLEQITEAEVALAAAKQLVIALPEDKTAGAQS